MQESRIYCPTEPHVYQSCLIMLPVVRNADDLRAYLLVQRSSAKLNLLVEQMPPLSPLVFKRLDQRTESAHEPLKEHILLFTIEHRDIRQRLILAIQASELQPVAPSLASLKTQRISRTSDGHDDTPACFELLI